ncbi:MAG: acetyltransferase, partial [Candidatus Omnitrophica bacterium]|nr:acetyltransferase [Candidatus Omnitrophota bacterium]
SIRGKIYKQLKEIGFNLPTIVHPAAVIAKECSLDEGVFIGTGAVVNPGTRVGKNAIINTLSSVDHDCQIAELVHIAPGVTLSGGVTIGKFSHIGVGTVVNQGINVGCNCLIGSGSVVISDIEDNSKAFGNPCKVMGKR